MGERVQLRKSPKNHGAMGAEKRSTEVSRFNVGVELGQLLFVLVALAVRAGIVKLPVARKEWAPYLAPYAIGSVAMYWVFERVAAF